MPRSATPLRPSTTGARRGTGTVSSASPNIQPTRVHRNGAIRWRGAEIYLSEALIGEPVGLIERQDGSWVVHYGPITLGVIDHRGDRLRKLKKACGFVDNPDELPTNPQAQQPQQQS